MTKAQRQSRILELVRHHAVYTQHEILERLKESGIEATQVTVSRDIHDLGLVKTPSGYQAMSGSAAARTLPVLAREFLYDAATARNLVVLRTKPGNAMGIAKALDEEAWPDIVGTIGGDDTVLIIAPDDAKADAVASRLLKLRE